MEIRALRPQEIKKALALVWHVFQKFEAPEYSREGVENFRACLRDPSFIGSLHFFGAWFGNELAGVIATRSQGQHIALFFVDEKRHRQGIGRRLFESVLQKCPGSVITVNSSPYAREAYHHLGFVETDTELSKDGIRFIPMKYSKPVAASDPGTP
jgi:GNAT superfamily N-acetyltransferase